MVVVLKRVIPDDNEKTCAMLYTSSKRKQAAANRAVRSTIFTVFPIT